MALPTARLAEWLGRLSNDNAQQEYYLTDIVGMAVADGVPVRTTHPAREWEVLGVNSKVQLAELERVAQRRPPSADGAGRAPGRPGAHRRAWRAHCGRDVFIDVNCVFEGKVVLEEAVEIGPACVLKNSPSARARVSRPSVTSKTRSSGRTA
jgi:bifunctional UDP-N-acetylglucosamine pyrophosphorylase/glucosamine-1-phosphate N-acetyltransferase